MSAAREPVTVAPVKAGGAAAKDEKPDGEEEDQPGGGMMREIYKHLLPVLAVVIVVAQLRKMALTPAHHVGAVW
jgi:hypothetical protein